MSGARQSGGSFGEHAHAAPSSPHGATAVVRPQDWALLTRRIERARTRAASLGRPVLASVTVSAPSLDDPVASVWAARGVGEPWFCFEQPDREAAAIAALGCALALESRGQDRFASCSARWRELASEAVGDDVGGAWGAGVVAVGGFAFSPDGGHTAGWDGFAPASLHVPTLSLARRSGQVRLTVTVAVTAAIQTDVALAELQSSAARLVPASLPLWDPDPATKARVTSVMPPVHYEHAVSQAVSKIRAGAFEKIVLAREVDVAAGRPHDPGAILGVLREQFPSCHIVGVGRGEAAFVAATPELLVRREGLRAGTLALAGSTPRGAEPGTDARLSEQLLASSKDREEHAIVTRRIADALAPFSVWVTVAETPVTVQMPNIQHLATPIRAQLARRVSVLELVEALHPTPAVGGEPFSAVTSLIPALEGMDRGWYAGPVGWVNANEDGEFVVALRSAVLRGKQARLFAGVGVVRDSDPAAELVETDVKLQALLPVLRGSG